MNIASIVEDLTLSQNSFYMIKNFNKLAERIENQPYCFYTNLSSVTPKPLFAIMNLYYVNFFNDGKIICTDLDNLTVLLNLNSAAEKFFYVWDLEWLRGNNRYIDSVDLMNNERVKLLARSNIHAKAIESYCGREIHAVVDNWNYKDLEKI